MSKRLRIEQEPICFEYPKQRLRAVATGVLAAGHETIPLTQKMQQRASESILSDKEKSRMR